MTTENQLLREREAFEAWAQKRLQLNVERCAPPEDGFYKLEETTHAWMAWDARATLAQPAANGEPTISTEHGPWLPSQYHEGETYCERCNLRSAFLGGRECKPHIVYTAPAAALDAGVTEADITSAREHIADVHNAEQLRSALAQLRPSVVAELALRGLVPAMSAQAGKGGV